MGLRCLLGHDFGEREVERDRREDGDEMVVTFRTVETCERCGERRVVSENKEIRSRERPDSTGAAPDGTVRSTPGDGGHPAAADGSTASRRTSDPGSDAAASEDVGGIVETPAGDDDATVIDADDRSNGAAGDAGVEPSSDEPADRDEGSGPPDAAEEDAVILTGDDGDGGDAPGDGPGPATGGGAPTPEADADTTPDDGAERDSGAWPQVASEDEGFDAAPHEDTDAGVEFGGELTPVEEDHAAFVDADPGPAPETTAEDANGTTFVRPEGGSTSRDVETEYRCPNCGATEATVASSLRAGDICPECHKGYVAERAVGEGGRNA